MRPEARKRSALRALALPVLALLGACASQPDHRPDPTPPPTVASVDLERYAGRWFEIARYPNSFQKGCVGTTADYVLRPDGRIRVLNACRIDTLDGKEKTAQGRARVVEGSNGSRLKVRFAPDWIPFAEGDYWILHLEPDYSAVLVGDPAGKYLWVLSRTPQLAEETYARVLERAQTLGYATAPLQLVLQPQG
jgi:apolipoprotein D and lipocalin family protein